MTRPNPIRMLIRHHYIADSMIPEVVIDPKERVQEVGCRCESIQIVADDDTPLFHIRLDPGGKLEVFAAGTSSHCGKELGSDLAILPCHPNRVSIEGAPAEQVPCSELLQAETAKETDHKAWMEGILFSAGFVAGDLDQPTMAADLLRAVGLNEADCSAMDEMDKAKLRLLQTEKHISLKGL